MITKEVREQLKKVHIIDNSKTQKDNNNSSHSNSNRYR